MDEPVIQTTEEATAGELERLWLEQRRRAGEILATQKTHLDEVELRLSAQVELIGAQLAAAAGDIPTEYRADLEHLRQELEQRQLKLEQDQEKAALELQQWSDQLRQKQHDIELHQEEIAASVRKIQQQERAVESARQEHDAEIDQFARRRARFEEQQRRLDSELEALEARREATKNQRQRIAQQLREERAKQRMELERQRSEIESLRTSIEQDNGSADLMRRELAGGQAELERQRELLLDERRKLEDATSEVDKARAQWEESRRQHERQLAAADDAAATREAAAKHEVIRLRDECERLNLQCAEQRKAAEESLAKNAAHADQLAQARQEIAHLHAELQTATDLAHGVDQELNALRGRNEELERRAGSADSAAGAEQLESLADEREALVAQTRDLGAQLAAVAGEHRKALEQLKVLDQTRVQERAASQAERSELLHKLDEATAALEALRSQSAGVTLGETDRAGHAAELEAARLEAAEAARRIGELEERLAAAESAPVRSSDSDDQNVQDLQRRFELAVEDVRSLKRRNAELEDQMTAVKAGGGAPREVSQGQDWESVKQRMLAELEPDASSDPKRKEERLSIDNTIRITDQVVGQKDQEIDDLKRLLAQQSSNLGSLAVGAAAIEEVFNHDEVIMQERARLEQTQQEWREKFRQAEIDISLERARLARERSELEDKLQKLETERAKHQASGPSHPSEKAEKPARGRWLERLGLKDHDK